MVGLTGISITISALVGMASVITAVLTYRSSVKVRRADWLLKLYSEFYEKEYLKVVRKKLDSLRGAGWKI